MYLGFGGIWGGFLLVWAYLRSILRVLGWFFTGIGLSEEVFEGFDGFWRVCIGSIGSL